MRQSRAFGHESFCRELAGGIAAAYDAVAVRPQPRHLGQFAPFATQSPNVSPNASESPSAKDAVRSRPPAAGSAKSKREQAKTEEKVSDGGNSPDHACVEAATIDHGSPSKRSIFSPIGTGESSVAHAGHCRYRIEAFHDEGGWGRVYRAHDEELNRMVALKEIKQRFADNPDSRERFVKEAEITGRLEHPGIVPVYGLGTYPDGRPYYAMRFIRGHSLQQAITKFRGIDWSTRRSGERLVEMRRLLNRFIDVCDAIYYAHRRGILHRDIKPGNIMLGDYGETLVVDWGLAKPMGKREDAAKSFLPVEKTLLPLAGSSAVPTMYGKAVGSPAFMSPEQARGEHDATTAASDIYGLGATLYAIVTNALPVDGEDFAEILNNVRQGRVIPARQRNRAVSKSIEAICSKAMSLRPEDRYESARELARDVERYMADEAVMARKEHLSGKIARFARKNRALVSAVVGAAFLLLCVSLLFTYLYSKKERQRQVQVALYQQEREEKRKRKIESETTKSVNNFLYATIAETADPAKVDEQRELIGAKVEQPLARAALWRNFALIYELEGKPRRVEETASLAIETLATLKPDEREVELAHEIAFTARKILAAAYGRQRRFEEALAELEQAKIEGAEIYDADDVDLIELEQLIATVHFEKGDYATAQTMFQAFIDKHQSEFAENDPMQLIGRCRMGFANCLTLRGDFEQAIPILQQLFEHNRSSPAFGPRHRHTLTKMHNLASAYFAARQFEKAIGMFQVLVPYRRESLGVAHPDTIKSQKHYANTLWLVDRLDQAVPIYQDIYEALASGQGQASNSTIDALRMVCHSLVALQKFELAHPQLEKWEKLVLAGESLDQRSKEHLAEIAMCRAEIALAENDFDLALRYVRDAEKMVGQRGAVWIRATLASQRSLIDKHEGETLDEKTHLEYATNLFDEIESETVTTPTKRFWRDRHQSRLMP